MTFAESSRDHKYTKKYKFRVNHFTEKIRKNVEKTLNKYHIHHNHETTRALGNAMRHGGFPVKATIYIYDNHGSSSCLVKIKDNGKGFDSDDVIKKYNNNEKYYSYRGKGTRILAESRANVWWNDNGRKIFIDYR